MEGAAPPTATRDHPLPPAPTPKWRPGPWVWALFVGLLALNWLISSLVLGGPERVTVPYTTFVTELEQDNVVEVSSRGDTIQGSFAKEVTYPAEDGRTALEFTTERPSYADDDLLSLLEAKGVVVNARPIETPTPWWQALLFGFGPTILLVVLFIWLMRRASGGMSGLGGLGKSKATLYQPDAKRTTFADVAGIDEATEELIEIVDFLRDPERYRQLGAMIPRGVLLTGPPAFP